MNRLFQILLTLIIGFSSLEASADGNYLLQRCEAAVKALSSPDATRQRAAISYCYGLLQGVREVNRLYEHKHGNSAYFCMGTKHLSHSETAKLVVNYLKQHPQRLHQTESILAVQALRQEFPCPK